MIYFLTNKLINMKTLEIYQAPETRCLQVSLESGFGKSGDFSDLNWKETEE